MPLQRAEPWEEVLFMAGVVVVQVGHTQQFQPLSRVEPVAALTLTLRAVGQVPDRTEQHQQLAEMGEQQIQRRAGQEEVEVELQ